MFASGSPAIGKVDQRHPWLALTPFVPYHLFMPSHSQADRLESWKAIAGYLRRSVRTVRRWEAEEGLPIHRQMHRSLATVYAYKSEIDAWQRQGEPGAMTTRVREDGPSTAHTAAAEKESIAVLPFTFVGPEAEDEYIADGFTDEVIADLSKIRSLRVISRTSSIALKGTGKDARSIGRELRVRFLLEGTVRRDGSRVRVSVRLIDPASDDRVWAEKYIGDLEDIFAIQERIARKIVEALRLQLTAEEDQRLSNRPVDNVVAWQCVLQARQEALRWRRDSIDHAIQLLLNGVSIVGDHADLYAALGRTYLQYREAGVDLGDRPLEQAEFYAKKVFDLDASSSAGLQLQGWIYYSQGRIQDAVRHLKAALENDWSNSDTLALLCNCYLISGQGSAARPIIERLLSIDPLTPLNRCLPGWADVLEGRFDTAINSYREMFEMDPGNPMGRLFYVWILALTGRASEAQEIAAGFPSALADSPPAQIAVLFTSSAKGKGPRAAPELGPETERLAAVSDMFPRFLAQAYAMLGDADRAVHWLSAAVDRGFINYPFLARHDPFLRRLEKHPPYVELLRHVRHRWEAFEP